MTVFEKIKRTIESCNIGPHYTVCDRMITLASNQQLINEDEEGELTALLIKRAHLNKQENRNNE